jgi:hypothetical protein
MLVGVQRCVVVIAALMAVIAVLVFLLPMERDEETMG